MAEGSSTLVLERLEPSPASAVSNSHRFETMSESMLARAALAMVDGAFVSTAVDLLVERAQRAEVRPHPHLIRGRVGPRVRARVGLGLGVGSGVGLGVGLGLG
eukprot:scaffold15504_cov56-Phaeocystis_antarctica.AAC.4